MRRKSSLPAKEMLFSLLFTYVLWVSVSGYQNDEIDDSREVWYNSHEEMVYAIPKDHDQNYPYARLEANYTGLRKQFQSRYVNRTYSKWSELHSAQPRDLNKVCQKWASVNSTNIPKPLFQQTDYFLYGEKTMHELFSFDMLECEIILRDRQGDEFARLEYYLCEGDEPGTAFRFSKIKAWQKSVNLFEKVYNVWDGTSLDDS